MNTHPHDHEGQPGTVYILHFEPAYRHARHYIDWALDVDARVAEHLAGAGSPLVRAAMPPACVSTWWPRSPALGTSSGA